MTHKKIRQERHLLHGKGENCGKPTDGIPFLNSECLDFLTGIFENSATLLKFVSGTSSSDMPDLLVDSIKGVLHSKLRRKKDDRVPYFVNEACKEVSLVVAHGATTPFNRKNFGALPGVKITQTVSCAQRTPTLSVKGTMPKVIKCIGSKKIAELIKKIVTMETQLEEIECQQAVFEKTFVEERISRDRHYNELAKIIRKNWPLLFSYENLPSIKESGCLYELVLNDVVLDNQVVPNIVGERAVILQNAIKNAEEGTEEQISTYEHLKENVRRKERALEKNVSVVAKHFEENPIDGCQPVLLAIDPKNGDPCLIVIADVSEELKEIPTGLLDKFALEHTEGDREIPTEIQECLGIKEMINRLKKNKRRT